MASNRATKAELTALAERVCRAVERAYDAAGLYIVLDHLDGDARIVDREQAIRAALAWQELGAMASRDRGGAQPGNGYAALQMASSALYELSRAIGVWAEGGMEQRACVQETEWYIGACLEYCNAAEARP